MTIDEITVATDCLSDADVKRMVITAAALAVDEDITSRHRLFWYRMAQELRGVVRRREGSLSALEADLMNDDGPGAIVEPGSDPVAQAQAELREAHRRDVEDGP